MRCIVTAGPTYEPLDDVRRLTNFSTGRLGTELANFLTKRGNEATLLLGESATFRGQCQAQTIQVFTTTEDLAEKLRLLGEQKVDAVFHAAAVSDFSFGKVWLRSSSGDKLTEIKAGKISTREGTLLAELLPTAKIIAKLRTYFPSAFLVGWKFEVDGDRLATIALAQKQIVECSTDACVANGPAYGPGFGLVQKNDGCTHLADTAALFDALANLIHDRRSNI